MADGRWTMEICCRGVVCFHEMIDSSYWWFSLRELTQQEKTKGGLPKDPKSRGEDPWIPKTSNRSCRWNSTATRLFFLLFLALFDRVSNICWSGGEKIKEAGRADWICVPCAHDPLDIRISQMRGEGFDRHLGAWHAVKLKALVAAATVHDAPKIIPSKRHHM